MTSLLAGCASQQIYVKEVGEIDLSDLTKQLIADNYKEDEQVSYQIRTFRKYLANADDPSKTLLILIDVEEGTQVVKNISINRIITEGNDEPHFAYYRFDYNNDQPTNNSYVLECNAGNKDFSTQDNINCDDLYSYIKEFDQEFLNESSKLFKNINIQVNTEDGDANNVKMKIGE